MNDYIQSQIRKNIKKNRFETQPWKIPWVIGQWLMLGSARCVWGGPLWVLHKPVPQTTHSKLLHSKDPASILSSSLDFICWFVHCFSLEESPAICLSYTPLFSLSIFSSRKSFTYMKLFACIFFHGCFDHADSLHFGFISFSNISESFSICK